MGQSEWILLDTETTGLSPPVFVVELAAKKMQGWQPAGTSFRRLINHGADIPPEAARVHGYTREILERDGDAPGEVYKQFADFAGNLPLVSYNLAYDLDQVLVPEWERLKIAPIGRRGFCALALAQRLLDPVPAGNCKLQTLRQFYRLPERGAHTAMGDVETVIDLFQKVIAPLAEARGLSGWEQIRAFTETEWFPSRITFGRHKGRSFREAGDDADLKGWIEWLSASSNPRSAAMGRWYLAQLVIDIQTGDTGAGPSPFEPGPAQRAEAYPNAGVSAGIAVYTDPEAEQLKVLIDQARSRLAELSAEYMTEKRAVDAVTSSLFLRLSKEYRRRDNLALLVRQRRRFLDTLLQEGEDAAEERTEEFRREKADQEKDFEDAEKQAAQTTSLSTEEKSEVQLIWKKLVRAFHPDQFGQDAAKRQTYEKLISVINHARDAGDIALLRRISDDPAAYIAEQGWSLPEKTKVSELRSLKILYEKISLEIIQRIEDLEVLRSSNGYEVLLFCRAGDDGLEKLVTNHRELLAKEIEDLQAKADRLSGEIRELLRKDGPF